MQVSAQEFLYMGGGLLGVIVFYISLAKRRHQPVRLRMRHFSSGAAQNETEASSQVPIERGFDIDWKKMEATAKDLNVFFNYNGHDWDAYEVLGIPAGANIELIRRAYHESLSKVDEPSRAFIDMAYNVILKKLNS